MHSFRASRFVVVGLLAAWAAPLAAAEKPRAAVPLTLLAPLEHQVVQRTSPGQGLVRIVGELPEDCPPAATIEARLVDAGTDPAWLTAAGSVKDGKFTAAFHAPAGGWRRLDVRLMHDRMEIARGTVAEVGIGEVFVVAGQSNSANHGAEKQVPKTGRVATFDGTAWRLAHDPQPGASGGGGSFMPPLGDALVERFGVPVGFVACGIGATSVREWLPKGATFPNPPTIEGRVERFPDGGWASKGEAFDRFVARMKSLGPRGFRAVLWHQGESDANQKDPSRTLPGTLYREYLERLIRDSRRAIGWDAPWFVAQASYHVPGDEGSDDIRAAQAALWKDGVAIEGPDSDALKGPLRERDGQGVHFSGPGLRAHAMAWAEKVGPWIDHEWTAPRRADGGTEWTRYELLPLSHSLGWVSRNVSKQGTGGWNGVLDEAKWGTPSPEQVVARNWDWKITDQQWREAVQAAGDGPREEVRLDLWLPDGVEVVRGIVVMSGHGSGENLFKRPDLRALARELGLAVFTFVGNPLQRGFWPRSLLFERLQQFGVDSGHPELAHAPLFLYGHSNGTGFSAIFAANEPDRVWGWVSMRPGITFQVYQPGAARVPGLVIFGEDDPFLTRPSREENLAVVPAIRRRHDAVWNMAVEPQTGHGPGENTWPLVFSFLRHTFAARVPADADPRKGPVPLRVLAVDGGQLGENWDVTKGGYQSLRTTAHADFPGDRSTASWLVNAAYAADWQAFQRDGRIARAESPATSAGPLVGAYYYPWYFPERWTREPVTHTPRLGWYSSGDREVATRHVAWAREAGIDFLLVSWLSSAGYEGRNLDAALLPALADSDRRFAILYETPLALGLPAGKPIDLAARLPDGTIAGDRFVADFDHLADRYLNHPRYLRLAGRPVVVVYLVRDMVNAAPTLKRVRERLAARGLDLHLIADTVYWAAVETWDWPLLEQHFQTVTAYNMYYRPDFLAAVEKQFTLADRAARDHGLRLVPSVMPGYDDTPLRGTDRVTINRRRGDFYRDFWRVAERFVTPDQPLLLVTSFNEWHEGTELEPSTEFGDAYLKQTRELVDRLRHR